VYQQRRFNLLDNDLPQNPELRDKVLLAIFGIVPDKRQIDGLGGADPLTSKLAMVALPTDRIPISNTPVPRWPSRRRRFTTTRCAATITSGVATFRGQRRPCKASTGSPRSGCSTATRKRGSCRGPRRRTGKPPAWATTRLRVCRTGAKNQRGFRGHAPARCTGKLLPTGNVRDMLDIPGVGKD
jgi:hypothetical protein